MFRYAVLSVSAILSDEKIPNYEETHIKYSEKASDLGS